VERFTPVFYAGRFAAKPVVVRAVKYNGTAEGLEKISEQFGAEFVAKDGAVYIRTLEGDSRCEPNCFIVQGEKGELHPVQESVFLQKYEELHDG